jgi:peroxiredoxin Q/BCP
VSLEQFRGKQHVVLYFYPKDDTPGCTVEACAFRDDVKEFQRRNAVVLGVSFDDTASHRRFIDKFQLPFPLLSDVEKAAAQAYGVYKQKSMYGKTFWGIERTTFLIDKQGVVRNIFPKVKPDGHSREVLQALDALNQT